MLAAYAFGVTIAAILLIAFLLLSMSSEKAKGHELASVFEDRRRLQDTLQQYSETIDANQSDMHDMRTKLSSHAEEIMQLRCANEEVTKERLALRIKLNHAQEGFQRIEAARITTMQRLTDTE